jgi:hypothetical protein
VQRIRQEWDELDVRLGAGVLLSLVAFFVIAGPRGVQPHYERYAIWTVVPVVLVLARGLAWWFSREYRCRNLAVTAALVLAAGWLVTFNRYYFAIFASTGGDSHLAFRTADSDPKQTALEAIAETAPETKKVVVSRNWWTRLPLEYLSADEPSVLITRQLVDTWSTGTSMPVFVELADSEEEREIGRYLNASKKPYRRVTYADRAGRAVVVTFQPLASRDESLKNFAPPQFDNKVN